MVICNDCGTRVAPKTPACPKCGAPVDATYAGPPRARRKAPFPWIAVVIFFAAAAIFSGGLILLLR
jgi:predicted amidophosphoribosyltransferase